MCVCVRVCEREREFEVYYKHGQCTREVKGRPHPPERLRPSAMK